MSTQNQNINIATSNINGRCDLKCVFTFKYSESNSTAKNNGVMISITYDQTSASPVEYVGQKYNVSTIMIVSPSLHLFNGSTTAGEIIIEHTPVLGGQNLNVCVPFTTSGDTSSASDIITDIINTVATNAPSEGETTNLNMSNFNLQTIVPKKPFYTYFDSTANWVVYGIIEAIPLTSSTIEILQQIISPYQLATQSDALFYNAKGPTNGISIGDGLYISCKPTGSTEDETAIEYNKSSTSTINIGELFGGKGFQTFIMILVGVLLSLVVFFGINYLYKYITADPKRVSLGFRYPFTRSV